VEPLLSLTKISAGYGSKCILEDVTLKVCSGEAIALIGHNGAGKTTALQTIFGLQAPWSGKINFDGHPLGSTHSAAEAVSLGMSMVPDGALRFRRSDRLGKPPTRRARTACFGAGSKVEVSV
jgi:ABC-type branched-subunit amino acid transport system ATPase component